MNEEKDDTQQETNTSHDNICNAQEWISSSQQTCSWYDNTLGSFEFLHLKKVNFRKSNQEIKKAKSFFPVSLLKYKIFITSIQ